MKEKKKALECEAMITKAFNTVRNLTSENKISFVSEYNSSSGENENIMGK